MKHKKNGELMFAVRDGVYFAIVIFWGLSGILLVGISILVESLILMVLGLAELVGGFVVLAYLNRDVPSSSEGWYW